jgi:hypothetical protein
MPYSFLQAETAKIGKDNPMLHLQINPHSSQAFG